MTFFDAFKQGSKGMYNYLHEEWTAEDRSRESIMDRILKKFNTNNGLSVQDLRDDPDSVNWEWVSTWFLMDEDTIREFKDYVNWPMIDIHQELSKDFRKEFADKLDWNTK